MTTDLMERPCPMMSERKDEQKDNASDAWAEWDNCGIIPAECAWYRVSSSSKGP